MIFEPRFTITPLIAKQLMAIERQREAIAVSPVSAAVIVSLHEKAQLLSIQSSAQIGGYEISENTVKQLISGKDSMTDKEKEMHHYFKAMDYVSQECRKKFIIDDRLISNINSLVFTGAKINSPYRNFQNPIEYKAVETISYTPPMSEDVGPLMEGLIKWITQSITADQLPAPIIAGIVHFQFVAIHPFYDGNGRTARLLASYILCITGYGLQGMYSLEQYYAKDIQTYFNALLIEDEYNYQSGAGATDITPFLEYFLKGLAFSFEGARKKAHQLNMEEYYKSLPQQTERIRKLNPLQKKTLTLFQKQREVSLTHFSQFLKLKPRRAYALLKKWLDEGFIQVGNTSKKARTYLLTAEWEQIVVDSKKEQFS